jgi:NAD(P)-dependent dehydrogenase (short-subunit alcohol dehydrogenase family)
MQIVGKVALITGASSGIGQATAQCLARAGAQIAAVDRSPESSQETIAEIQQNGGKAISVIADVSKAEEVKRAIEEVISQFGRIDVVFANAGINGTWAPIEDLTPDEWQQTLDVNLTGTFLTVKYAMPYLKQQGGSVIINASVNGTRIFSNTGATAYACSKAAQVAFAKMIALEVAADRVRVNVICPGAIDTGIGKKTEQRNLEQAGHPAEFPKGRVPLTGGGPGKPEQVAQLVLFLASDASDHITGTEIWIDGAESLLQG